MFRLIFWSLFFFANDALAAENIAKINIGYFTMHCTPSACEGRWSIPEFTATVLLVEDIDYPGTFRGEWTAEIPVGQIIFKPKIRLWNTAADARNPAHSGIELIPHFTGSSWDDPSVLTQAADFKHLNFTSIQGAKLVLGNEFYTSQLYVNRPRDASNSISVGGNFDKMKKYFYIK